MPSVVVAVVLAVLAVACQGGDPSDGDAADGDAADGDAATAPDEAEGPDDGSADVEPEADEADPGADAGPREALAFTARSLEGGEVDVSALTDGPVLLWMWAPW